MSNKNFLKIEADVGPWGQDRFALTFNIGGNERIRYFDHYLSAEYFKEGAETVLDMLEIKD